MDNDKSAPLAKETNYEALIWEIDSIIIPPGQDRIMDIEELIHTTAFPALDPAVYSITRGSIIWPDTSAYLGELRIGKADGSGTLVFPDGTRYNGQWRNNMFWGEGELIFPSGERYQGTFEEHMIQGFGTCLAHRRGLQRAVLKQQTRWLWHLYLASRVTFWGFFSRTNPRAGQHPSLTGNLCGNEERQATGWGLTASLRGIL